MRSPHLWIIAALMAILAISYYADHFNISTWLPWGKELLTTEYIHDLHRALFLIPMLYAATIFRFRGALVASIIVLCVVLPRSLFISPHPDPMLRAVIFAVLAGLASLLLGLERDHRQREKKAQADLDVAHRELQNNAKLLRASEARFRDLFNSASDAIFVRDLEGNILEVNQAASALSGYTIEELAKMNISQFLSAESFKTAVEKQQRQFQNEVTSQRYELELIKKDGTKAIIESVTRLIRENGQPVGIQAMVRDVTQQRRMWENMQFYVAEITKAQEEERKRIARELHDETAQALAALSLDIEVISRARDQLSEETMQKVEQLRAKIGTILEGVRRFSHELRPPVLDQVGLVPALEMLSEELDKEGKIHARIEVTGSERRLSSEAELVLFRIAQEALRNVRKHSQATETVVRVEFTPKKVKVTVIDNGSGFELPEVLGDFAGRGKLGLIGMQERARLLGGIFSVKSQAGKGTTVAVEVVG